MDLIAVTLKQTSPQLTMDLITGTLKQTRIQPTMDMIAVVLKWICLLSTYNGSDFCHAKMDLYLTTMYNDLIAVALKWTCLLPT